MKEKIVKVVMAVYNSQGDPDFAFVKISDSLDGFANGTHFEKAEDWATLNGYEFGDTLVMWDEEECPDWLLDRFEWGSADVY